MSILFEGGCAGGRCDDSDEDAPPSTPRVGRPQQRLEGAPEKSEEGQAGLIGLVELGNLKPRTEHSIAAKVLPV